MIMSDPEIIKSETPHSVSMPEGSSNAVGKKAEVGEASIRKVLSEGSGETNEIEIDEEKLKGPPPKLSSDDEIVSAKAAILKNNDLRAEKQGVHAEDDLRAEKAAHQASHDLRAKSGVSVDEELRAAKGFANSDKDLQAEKEEVKVSGDLRGAMDPAIASDDLRAEKSGVNNNELRAPKEGVSSGDLKAPKDILDSLADLLAPKNAAKSDAELRGPKELVKSNSAAMLPSADLLAALRPGISEAKDAKADILELTQDVSEEPSDLDAASSDEPFATQGPEPEMNFPARVVHLKIENDTLRSALDKLESKP